MKVRFHLPGLRHTYPLNMLVANMLRSFPEFFRPGVEIASFYGEFPTSRWNGGRFSNGDQCDAGYIRHVVESINSQGIGICYTFTNPMITPADLNDPYCNFCMMAADNGQNGVLVVSPLLEAYIREKYPGFQIGSSGDKQIQDVDALNRELEQDYGLAVLDYNLNNRFDLLGQIGHREKCAVLVNSCCVPKCPRREEHNKQVARQQYVVLKNRGMSPDKQAPVPDWHCEYKGRNSLYTIRDYPTFVSPDDIWEKYVPMGFENFMIEGRTANLFSLIDRYAHYMMKPERRDEGRLMLTLSLERSRVIQVNKPRKSPWI